MVQFYLVPSWFFGFGVALEFLFGLVTLAVALYSFKIYKYSQQRELKIFGLGFLLMSLAYFMWAAISWYVPNRLQTSTQVVELADLNSLVAFGVYVHVFFFILGLVTLAYVTLNAKSQRVYTLIAGLCFATILFSSQKIVSFYFVSSLLFFYILVYYGLGYMQGRKLRSGLTLLAFAFLFLGTVDFTFSAVNHVHYIVGHVLYFVGYLLILVSLVSALRPFRIK